MASEKLLNVIYSVGCTGFAKLYLILLSTTAVDTYLQYQLLLYSQHNFTM